MVLIRSVELVDQGILTAHHAGASSGGDCFIPSILIQFEFHDDCEERIKVESARKLDCSNVLGADVVYLTYFPVIVDLQGRSL